jgi:hypothetical protein
VDVLGAFLSALYANKTSGTEAWSLVYSTVQRMFDDTAVHRCLDSLVDSKNGVKQQVTTECLWASLQVQAHLIEGQGGGGASDEE